MPNPVDRNYIIKPTNHTPLRFSVRLSFPRYGYSPGQVELDRTIKAAPDTYGTAPYPRLDVRKTGHHLLLSPSFSPHVDTDTLGQVGLDGTIKDTPNMIQPPTLPFGLTFARGPMPRTFTSS